LTAAEKEADAFMANYHNPLAVAPTILLDDAYTEVSEDGFDGREEAGEPVIALHMTNACLLVEKPFGAVANQAMWRIARLFSNGVLPLVPESLRECLSLSNPGAPAIEGLLDIDEEGLLVKDVREVAANPTALIGSSETWLDAITNDENLLRRYRLAQQATIIIVEKLRDLGCTLAADNGKRAERRRIRRLQMLTNEMMNIAFARDLKDRGVPFITSAYTESGRELTVVGACDENRFSIKNEYGATHSTLLSTALANVVGLTANANYVATLRGLPPVYGADFLLELVEEIRWRLSDPSYTFACKSLIRADTESLQARKARKEWYSLNQ
jgi:hypothetical protein